MKLSPLFPPHRKPAWIMPLVLAMMLALPACSATLSTATRDLDASITGGVCGVWQDIPYASKHDTPETVKSVRKNNAARDAYCNGVVIPK